MMRGRRRLAWLLVASLLILGAAAPLDVAADGDQLAEQATVTYRLDRQAGEVAVRAAFSITNRVPNTRTSRFYIDRWNWVAVPSYANAFRITGRGVSARQIKYDGAWRYYQVRFPRIFNGQRVSFIATWTLPSRGIGAINTTRVSDAYSHFCWVGQGVDTGTVSAVLPRGVDQETSGDPVRTRTRTGATTVSAKQRTNLYSFGACTDVYDTEKLIRGDLTSPAGHEVVIEGWPGETTWLDTTEQNVGFALSKLEGIVGAPIPGNEPIVIREAASNALQGYAGYFDTGSSVIRLNEESTAAVTIAHEIAHAWFTRKGFAATWMSEGLAEWAARTAVDVPCIEPSAYPGKGAPRLGRWRYLGYKPSQAQIDLVDYQYEASCAIMTRVADAIGADRMRDVLAVLLDGRSPYDRLTVEVPVAPSPAASSPPDGRPGPGEPSSPAPFATIPVPYWSVTASSPRRTKAVDWKQWLDAVDQLGLEPAAAVDPSLASRSLIEHGIATDKQLRGRGDARAAFQSLQALTPGGITPALVRRLLDDWRFDDARSSIELATEVATSLLASPLAGSDPTSAPWVAFEAAKRRQDLQRVGSMVD